MEYQLDIETARHERAEKNLIGIIVAELAAILLLALWRDSRDRFTKLHEGRTARSH